MLGGDAAVCGRVTRRFPVGEYRLQLFFPFETKLFANSSKEALRGRALCDCENLGRA